MNENENNFDALRQLLQLKRHETPPPGYFDRFSGQVIARIRAGEAMAQAKTSWFGKFLQIFEFKPAFAGAFASAFLLLLVFGIVYSDSPDSSPQPFFQNSEASTGTFAAAPQQSMLPTDSIGLVASNSLASSLQPVTQFFGQPNSFAQPVSLTIPAN
jgi:hypothetical protein